MKTSVIIGTLILGLATTACLAQQPGTPPRTDTTRGEMRPPPPDALELSGTADAYNYSPQGVPESLMLTTGDHKTVQLNFPPEVAPKITAAVNVGDKIQVEALPDQGGPAQPRSRGAGNARGQKTQTAPPADTKTTHPIYMLASLTTAAGKTLDLRPDRTPVALDGTIKQLNYSRQGIVNGFVLADGKLVLLPPQPLENVTLTVGEKITGEACARPTGAPGSVPVLEATTINGQTLRDQPPPPQDGAGPPDQPGPPPNQ